MNSLVIQAWNFYVESLFHLSLNKVLWKETMIDMLQYQMGQRGIFFPRECLEHPDVAIVGLKMFGKVDDIVDPE